MIPLFLTGTIVVLLLTFGFIYFISTYHQKLLKARNEQLEIENQHQQNLLIEKAENEKLMEELNRQQSEKQELVESFRVKLIDSIIQSQENERKKIAQEIHDDLGSLLWGLKLNLQHIVREGDLQGDLRVSGQECDKALEDALELARRIAQNLSPKTLESEGLTAATRELCQRIDNSKKIRTSFHVHGREVQLEQRVSISVYRIIQELLNNIVKHSGASMVDVSLTWGPVACLTIEDNGKPFVYALSATVNSSGMGVMNVFSRLRSIGGSLKSASVDQNKLQIFFPTH